MLATEWLTAASRLEWTESRVATCDGNPYTVFEDRVEWTGNTGRTVVLRLHKGSTNVMELSVGGVVLERIEDTGHVKDERACAAVEAAMSCTLAMMREAVAVSGVVVEASTVATWAEGHGRPLVEYSVNYRGGLPEYPKSSLGGIKFRVWPGGFEFLSTTGSKGWFAGMQIPFDVVTGVEIAQRNVSAFEGILGGLDSRQLNQANNIHVAFWRDGVELVLRVEMLSGTFVMSQAGKCRDLMDLLRNHGLLAAFEANRAKGAAMRSPVQVPAVAAPAEDIPGQIRKLAALRDEGILTPEEFAAKKADLLNRM